MRLQRRIRLCASLVRTNTLLGETLDASAKVGLIKDIRGTTVPQLLATMARRVVQSAVELLPEPAYETVNLPTLLAQIQRVRVRCDIAGIEGWLSPTERKLLYALARALPGPFAEVGSWVGLSTCIICAGIRDSGQPKEFVTHELNPSLDWFRPYGNGIGFFPPGAAGPCGESSIESFNREIRPVLEKQGGAVGQLIKNLSERGYREMVRIEEGDFGTATKRPYGLVFADVLHDPAEISQNGPKLAGLVGPGTLLACHDSSDENEAVLRNYVNFEKLGRVHSILVAKVT